MSCSSARWSLPVTAQGKTNVRVQTNELSALVAGLLVLQVVTGSGIKEMCVGGQSCHGCLHLVH